MRFYETAGDGQPQSGSGRTGALIKAIKDSRQLLFRDAGAGVDHANLNALGLDSSDSYVNASTPRRET